MSDCRDDLDPSGPAQPPLDDVYQTSGNAASKEPYEQRKAAQTDNSAPTDTRIPSTQGTFEDATPSSLGRGVRGAGAGEEKYGRDHEDVGRHKELDADQMAAPGEGKIADAVGVSGGGTSGRSGQQEDFVSDLDRKKAEQQPMREEIEAEREKNVDVGGILGQRGGPANPVDKNNYPNSSS